MLSGISVHFFQKEGGFKIINLSEKIEEIDDEHVYLISWKKIFKEGTIKND